MTEKRIEYLLGIAKKRKLRAAKLLNGESDNYYDSTDAAETIYELCLSLEELAAEIRELRDENQKLVKSRDRLKELYD